MNSTYNCTPQLFINGIASTQSLG